MIYQDKERTGECHFMMAKNTFAKTHLYIGVPKKSPYLQAISEGYSLRAVFISIWLFSPINNWFTGFNEPRRVGCLIIGSKSTHMMWRNVSRSIVRPPPIPACRWWIWAALSSSSLLDVFCLFLHSSLRSASFPSLKSEASLYPPQESLQQQLANQMIILTKLLYRSMMWKIKTHNNIVFN